MKEADLREIINAQLYQHQWAAVAFVCAVFGLESDTSDEDS